MIRENVIRAVGGRGGRGRGGYRIPADEVARLAAADVSRAGRNKMRKPLELRAQGKYLYRIGRLSGAQRCYEDASRASRELGDELGEAKARYKLGQIALTKEDWPEAKQSYGRALLVYSRKDPRAMNSVRLALGDLWLRRDDVGDAERRRAMAKRWYRRVLRAAGEQGRSAFRDWAVASRGLGMIALEEGDLPEAQRHIRAAYRVADHSDDRPMRADAIVGLVALEKAQGEYDTAVELLRRALAVYEEFGFERRAREAREEIERLRRLAAASSTLPWTADASSS
jgi:tetratricopeptide (TPR) repeat protein